MNLRSILTTALYGGVLAVSGLVISGNSLLAPSVATPSDAQAALRDSGASSFLLCDGCFYGTLGRAYTFPYRYSDDPTNYQAYKQQQLTEYQGGESSESEE